MPDPVLEYRNAMLSDKDLGLVLLELTDINQIITLMQLQALPSALSGPAPLPAGSPTPSGAQSPVGLQRCRPPWTLDDQLTF